MARGLRDFFELMSDNTRTRKSVCVGLDSDFYKLPQFLRAREPWREVYRFNATIIESTKHVAAAYKLNLAFYQALGPDGLRALQLTVDYVKDHTHGVPTILDAKYGDIGNTNYGYVSYTFDQLGADGVTVAPYMGAVAMAPFLQRATKGIFVLCRTSNEGAGELQDLTVDVIGEALYKRVARNVATIWNTNSNCGLVAGATNPRELLHVRKLAPNLPILVPGVGAQGGDVKAAVSAAKDESGHGFLINSSRGIIFASSGYDYPEAAAREAESLHRQIGECFEPIDHER